MPLCACVVLLLALALQFVFSDVPLDSEAARPPRIAMITAPGQAMQADAIMKAPIFAPDRAPVGVAALVPAGGGALALLGLAVSKERAVALIRDSSGVVQRLKVGQLVDGWTFSGVKPGQATIEKNGIVRVLDIEKGTAAAVKPTDASDGAADKGTQQ